MPEIRVNDCELHYERLGDHPSRCLVFINGLGMDLSYWKQLYVKELAHRDYSMLLFNARGTAPSQTSPPPYSVAGLARDAHALVRALGFEQVVLAGVSFGSLVAQELALLDPRAVRGLFLIGTLGRTSAIVRAILDAEGEVYRSGQYPPKSYMLLCDLLQVCSARELTDDRFVKSSLRMMDLATDYRAAGRQAQFFAAAQYDYRLERLRDIRAQTYVVALADDVITPAHLCREVAATIPRATYIEIPAAGHMGIYSRQREILTQFRRLLGDLGWSSAAAADSVRADAIETET